MSFIIKGKNLGDDYSLHISGGDSNNSLGNDSYQDYNYSRDYKVPFNAFSGSNILAPDVTGSHYRRFIFKSQQNYFRPEQVNGQEGADIFTLSDYTSTSTDFEIKTITTS